MKRGVWIGAAAYTLWGLFPLYWTQIESVPALQIIAHRIAWSFIVLLALMAARSTAGFVQFIVTVSNPFYAPFRGIVASPSTDSGHTLLLPIVIAIISYALLHLGINALLRMMAHRKTAI